MEELVRQDQADLPDNQDHRVLKVCRVLVDL